MWFPARAVSVNGKSSRLRRLDGGCDPLDRMREAVEPAVSVPVLDRAADCAGLGYPGHRKGGVFGLGADHRSRGRSRPAG